MANNAVVGILRALLTADTAQFESGMRKAADAAKVFARDTKSIGLQATALGQSLTTTLTLPIIAAGGAMAKTAIDFESSFAGVRKTVNATGPELEAMAQQFRNLSKQIPVNVNDLNRLGEAAGALGIPKDKIVDFSRVMAELGVTTNVTADQAAESIAKIQNVFKAAGQDTENFASALVALGNDGASTEAQILETARRISSAGAAAGVSQAQVLGFASAIANVGIEAEAGGSALSRTFSEITLNVAKGGAAIEGFAKVAGMSAADFTQKWKVDAGGAMQAFIEGLGKVQATGGNLVKTLADLGITELRQADLLRSLALSGDNLSKSLETANRGWRENTALSKEAETRFATTASQAALLWNRIKDLGITIGNALLPMIKAAIKAFDAFLPVLESMAKVFSEMPMPIQAGVVAFAGILAAAGPVLLIFGQLALAASNVAAAFAAKGIATRALLALFGPTAAGMQTVNMAMIGGATAAGILSAAIAAVGAAFVGWQIGKVIADLKLFGAAQMSVGESFEFGATKAMNWIRGIKASDADIETAILSRRKLAESTQKTGEAAVAAAQQQAQHTGANAAGTIAAATLRAELEANRRTLAALSADKKADIAAGLAMGKSHKDIAEAVGVAIEVVDLFAKSVQSSTAAKKKDAEETKKWAAEQGKLIIEHAQETAKKQQDIAENRSRIQLENITRTYEAEQDLAKTSREIEFQRAEFAIEQAKRRGASEQQLFEMQTELDRRRLDEAIRMSELEYRARVAGIDRTTADGERLYQALTAAHRAQVDQMVEDQRNGEILKREEIRRSTSFFLQAWQTTTDGLKRIQQTIADGFGKLFFDIDGEHKTFGQKFVALWHDIKAQLFSIFNDILGQFINGLIKGMIGALTGQKGAMSSAFSGFLGGAGGGGQGGGGGILGGLLGMGGGGGQGGGGGGLLGKLFGFGGGGATQVGNVNGTIDALSAGGGAGGAGGGAGGFLGMSGGTAMQFLGGGAMAAGGALWGAKNGFLSGEQGWGNNIGSGALTGAGIGTMILPGVGTIVGAGIGAAGGAIKVGIQKLLGIGGPDKEEQSGRAVSNDFKTMIGGMLNEQQKLEAGGEQWKQVVIGVRDAYLATGKTEAEALAAVNAMYAAEKQGGAAVEQSLIPINAALHEQRQKAEQLGASLVDSFRKGEMGAADVMDALARIKAPDDIVIKIRTQIEGGTGGFGPLGTITGSDTHTRAERQGGSGSGSIDAINKFRSEHPERAGEIDDFLRKNPEDYDRLARILGIPGFHTGGLVGPFAGRMPGGEILARLLPSEGVVNRTGMSALGSFGLDSLNRGDWSDPFAAMGSALAAANVSSAGGTLPTGTGAGSSSSAAAAGGNGALVIKIENVNLNGIDGPSIRRMVDSGEFLKAVETSVRRDRHAIRSSLTTLLN